MRLQCEQKCVVSFPPCFSCFPRLVSLYQQADPLHSANPGAGHLYINIQSTTIKLKQETCHLVFVFRCCGIPPLKPRPKGARGTVIDGVYRRHPTAGDREHHVSPPNQRDGRHLAAGRRKSRNQHKNARGDRAGGQRLEAHGDPRATHAYRSLYVE